MGKSISDDDGCSKKAIRHCGRQSIAASRATDRQGSPFLEAGRFDSKIGIEQVSVRPFSDLDEVSTYWGSEVSEDVGDLSEDDGEDPAGEIDVGDQFEGDEPVGSDQTDRVQLDREDEFIRRLVDPKLPTPEEVKVHELKGHVEYRNWCPICIKARGKDLDHTRDK